MEDKYEPASRKKGLGLRSLESRATFLDASFEMHSEKGKGMSTKIRMPLTSYVLTLEKT